MSEAQLEDTSVAAAVGTAGGPSGMSVVAVTVVERGPQPPPVVVVVVVVAMVLRELAR